jgi:hypothetical protein
MVLLENFNPHHSVYRVLGKSLLACKEHFTLVAVAWPGYVKALPDDFFDVTITLSGTGDDYCLDEVVEAARQYRPDAVYYPSLGMAPWTIYYSNVRLAPVQFCAIGHGASSQATEVDYFLIEADIAGDPLTYSEKLVRLPPGAMPFYPPSWVEYRPRAAVVPPNTVHIVCCASFIKLNWRFLALCRRLDQRYRAGEQTLNVKFSFFVGAASEGLEGEVCRRLILDYLPDAVVHFHQPFQIYLDKLAEMDISLSPFPFGGMNGVMDSARLGVVGVCMEGPQVHEAFDGGMWRRMGMPEWLIAHDEAEYESAVIRLIEHPEERLELGKTLVQGETWKTFFDGDASVFSEHLLRLVEGDETLVAETSAGYKNDAPAE